MVTNRSMGRWWVGAWLAAAVVLGACGGAGSPAPAVGSERGQGGPEGRGAAGVGLPAGERCSVAVVGSDPDALTGASLRATVEPLIDRCGRSEQGAAAQVTAQFAIGATGCVEEIALRPEPAGPELAECLRGAFERLRFPAPGQGGVVLVRYPVSLAASAGK